MEVKVETLNGANAKASSIVKKSELDAQIQKLAQKASKNVKIDGFRAGKVPVSVVLKRYAKELENDAKQDIFKEIIEKSLKELDKKPAELIGEPIISKFEEDDNGIDIEMTISFKPAIDLSGFEEIIPEYTKPEASKEEIQAKIDEFLKVSAKLVKADKEAIEEGDTAKFDFEGFVDGVAFEGGKAEGYQLEVGSKQFIPGFEEGMLGLKVGEEKDITVTFPKEYGAEHLAGKDAVFKVKLHEILVRDIPASLSDEVLKETLPHEKEINVEKFEKRIASQIQADKFNKLILDELKPKFAEALVEKFNFDIPNNIVEQEIDMQFRNSWSSFTEEDMKKFREDKDALSKQRETYRDEAVKSVKLTFMIDELARLKDVKVSDQELMQAIYFEAYQHGVNPKDHLENYKKQGMLPAVKMALVEEKLFNSIFSNEEETKGE